MGVPFLASGRKTKKIFIFPLTTPKVVRLIHGKARGAQGLLSYEKTKEAK